MVTTVDHHTHSEQYDGHDRRPSCRFKQVLIYTPVTEQVLIYARNECVDQDLWDLFFWREIWRKKTSPDLRIGTVRRSGLVLNNC